MAIIIQRVLKGSPLTLQEHDDNFNNLNSELATKATVVSVDLKISNAVNVESQARINADNLEITNRNTAIVSGNTSTLNSAKSYTDSKIATEVSDRNSEILNNVTALKGGVTADGDTLGKLRTLITGSNTGINTGDETTASIKSKLNIVTLSGVNTGDQSLFSLGIPNVENKSSATIRNEIVSNNVINALGFTPINPNVVGVPNGIASLDSSGLIFADQLPSYVDDVIEVASLSQFPLIGATSKIYIALDSNKTYRWSGSTYVYITSGAVDSVAGKTGVVVLTKADVGLTNVDNTADSVKPVSTIQQSALNLKANLSNPILTGVPAAPTAATGTNTTQLATTAFVQTEIANDAAPIAHVGATGAAHGVATTVVAGFMSAADKTKLDGITGSGDVTSVAGRIGAVVLNKTDVGLNNVDNTTDIAKPISTAQASALALKANIESPSLSGTPTAPTALVGTSTTQLATTAFVQAEIAADAPTKTGGGASGTWPISINNTAALGTKIALVTGIMASNDTFSISIGDDVGIDKGYAEIATGDNGTEPIYVRQYTTGTLTRSATLLDSNGNTTFPGNLTVNGALSAITKSFLIDHPTKEGMKLRYGSLEGPENGVYVRGRLTGTNTIELPEYWTALIDSSSITVNLTPFGRKQDLFVSSIGENIINIAGDNPDCYYTVFAERKDIDKLLIEE